MKKSLLLVLASIAAIAVIVAGGLFVLNRPSDQPVPQSGAAPTAEGPTDEVGGSTDEATEQPSSDDPGGEEAEADDGAPVPAPAKPRTKAIPPASTVPKTSSTIPAGVTWDTTAKSFTVDSGRVAIKVDYASGVVVSRLTVDDGNVLDPAVPSVGTRITPTGLASVDAAAADSVNVTTTTKGISASFELPFDGGTVTESWLFVPVGDSVTWTVDRDYDLDAPTSLATETGVLLFAEEAWQNVRRPLDGGNIPVGGDALVDAAAEFGAIDGLHRNGILLETAPNHAVFDTSQLVFLTHDQPSGLAVSLASDSTVGTELARTGTPTDAAGLEVAWRAVDGPLEYANGNESGYRGRFSEVADAALFAPATVTDGASESATITLAPEATADYYDGLDLVGVDSDALSRLVNDFGRTIVQGADIGASSERSFRAGEAPGFTSPWNVWSLELLQDEGAFASMRGQYLDIFALPKRDPAALNTPVGGQLGGLQDTDGRIHCCTPYGVLNESQPTYATTDNTINVVFSAATLYDLDPDADWLSAIAEPVRAALGYAENELLITSGPTAGLFANAQCADPQSVTGCFIDWSEWNDQYDIGQVSAYHNVFAYGALTKWAELEREVLGDSARADHYEALAAGVKAAYNRDTSAGGFWSTASNSFAYTRTADGQIAKDCSHLFTNGYASMVGLIEGEARELTMAESLRESYGVLETSGHVYDHGAQGGTDYTWKLHGSNPRSCASGETLENGWPRMYFPFFEDGGVHLLNEQPAAQIPLLLGDRSVNVQYANQVVDRYSVDGFMGWSNIQPDTLEPRRDIWQEPFMVNNVLGAWPLYHDVLGFQPHHDRLDLVPAIDATMVGSSLDYTLHGDQAVSVSYPGTDSYTVSFSGDTPVRIGWKRLAGTTHTLTVDGVTSTVTAAADGMVWADGVRNGSHTYSLTGELGITFDDSAVDFSAGWWQAPGDTFLGGSLRGSSVVGETATLRFTGTGASILASTGGDKGIATVTLDGVELDPADWFATSGLHLQRTVTVTGLAAGDHVLVITVSGSHSASSVGNQLTIDGVVVFGGGLTPPDPNAPSETAVHPSTFTYTGTWWGVADPAFLLGELRGTSEADATATISFTGTGVSLSGSTGGDKGRAQIVIDGVDHGVVDWYSTGSANRVALFAIDGLTAGAHTLVVTVLPTASPGSVGTQVNLDGALVRTGT